MWKSVARTLSEARPLMEGEAGPGEGSIGIFFGFVFYFNEYSYFNQLAAKMGSFRQLRFEAVELYTRVLC
jgi:hypothetical protein